MRNLNKVIVPPKPYDKIRSDKWPEVRKQFLLKHPTCAACGAKNASLTKSSLAVHHKVPFHIDPTKELDETNLITLCENTSRICHYVFGHFYDWVLFNPNVVNDTASMLQELQKATAVKK